MSDDPFDQAGASDLDHQEASTSLDDDVALDPATGPDDFEPLHLEGEEPPVAEDATSDDRPLSTGSSQNDYTEPLSAQGASQRDDLDAQQDGSGALVDPDSTFGDHPGVVPPEADLSQSSGNPDDDPDTQRLADAEARGVDRPEDVAFFDDQGQPVYKDAVPAPIHPSSTPEEVRRRTNFERLLNSEAEMFANQARDAWIAAKSVNPDAGLTIKVTGVDDDDDADEDDRAPDLEPMTD